jgi:hypothetical protein
MKVWLWVAKPSGPSRVEKTLDVNMNIIPGTGAILLLRVSGSLEAMAIPSLLPLVFIYIHVQLSFGAHKLRLLSDREANEGFDCKADSVTG